MGGVEVGGVEAGGGAVSERGRNFFYFLKKNYRRSEDKRRESAHAGGVGNKGGFVVYGRWDVHV